MKSLKILMGAVLLTLVIGTTVWAGPFGPPEPLPDPGQFSLGAGYWSDGTGMKDGDRLGLRSHQYYLRGDYSFLKDWEVYGRAGAADETIHDHDLGQRFTDGSQPYGTLGFKGVVYRNGNFAVGPFIEGSWYGDHSGVTNNQWDANLGISAQYKIPIARTALTVYGGPFAYMHEATSEISALPNDGIRERSNLGGFLGVGMPVFSQKLFLTVEAQMKDKIGTGASLSYKF
jgi:hypothetical protein